MTNTAGVSEGPPTDAPLREDAAGTTLLRAWHHTSFTVRDMERALALYRDALGLTVVLDQEVRPAFAARVTGVPGAALRIVFLRLGATDHLLELIQYRTGDGVSDDVAQPARGTPPGAHVCFLVEDLAEVHRRLSARGFHFVSQPVAIAHGPNRGGWTVYLRDEDGATVELLQQPPAEVA